MCAICKEMKLTVEEIIGIIRTLNSSRVTCGDIGNSDTGYLQFIMENIGDDSFDESVADIKL